MAVVITRRLVRLHMRLYRGMLAEALVLHVCDYGCLQLGKRKDPIRVRYADPFSFR
jgi:hypothetical protein